MKILGGKIVLIVHSNQKLNDPDNPPPGYWVTHEESSEILYESFEASDAIQWAIDKVEEAK